MRVYFEDIVDNWFCASPIFGILGYRDKPILSFIIVAVINEDIVLITASQLRELLRSQRFYVYVGRIIYQGDNYTAIKREFDG